MTWPSVGVSLGILLTTMLVAVPPPTTTAGPALPQKCPVKKCNCTSTSLRCSDLGEQSRVPDFTAVVTQSFSLLQFVGRTKIRAIQTRAFSGLGVQRLQLDGLGVRDIEPGAFLGVSDLLDVDVRHNHISGVVDSRTFAVDSGLQSLDVSGNDIESVSSDVFALVGRLSFKNLSLANNRLTFLPDQVFTNLTGLERLDLSDNRLTNLTRPLFDDLVSLRRLFLANNRISNIDSTVFNSLASLDHLALENNELSSLPTSAFSGLYSLRTLTLQGNRLNALHSEVFTLKYNGLSTLNLDRNRVVDLTQVEISRFSSIRTLKLAANRLTTIPRGHFVGLSSMNVLDLSRNNISSVLNASSFEGLTSLSSLNLSSNNINHISAGTFGSSLHTLDLSENDYLEYMNQGVFENANNLTNLYLRNNGLYKIPRGVFNNMVSLENLDLSDNFITIMNSSSFENLPSLRRIDLSKNNIYSVPSDLFVNTSQLLSVAFDENRLGTVPVDIVNSLLNLQNFTLAHNRIGKLQALQSQSVEILILTGNEISDIVDGAFNGTPRITELYLDQNKLRRIRAPMFSGLNYLNRLDLSDNEISTIDIGSFRPLRYLMYLSLHGNQLTSIESNTLVGLLSINSLDLSANRLVSDVTDGLRQLPALRELILDDNDIISFNVNYLLNVESSLQRLSLRRNRISELQFDQGFTFLFSFLDLGENQITGEIFHSLQYLKFLEILKLDGNDISSVPTVGILNQSLIELDLSNNALTDSSLATIVQLRRLQQLRLDGNLIGNISAADWGLLANSLSVLSLSNNRLTSLNQIEKLWSLAQLDVDINLIESIPDATFRTLYDLEVLSLRGNRLTTIGQSTLDGLEQKCTQLDFSSNYIEFVHPKAFHRLKNITRLNISNNAIKELVIPPIMGQLSELLLSNNRLTRFPDGLRDLRTITVLSMYNNAIDSMPPLDIGNEFGVRLVDLSYNRLRNIDEVRLVGSLNVINIDGNELADIGADVFADATFIRELNLSNNALGRLPVAVTLTVDRIARLYADRCSLTSLDNWVVARSLTTRLIELSLSGNRLTVLPATVIASVMTSLEDLDMRGNLLTTLTYFERPYQFRRLSLAGNPWLCDCELAWLRGLSVTFDNATCWTPSSTVGQHVICYDADGCFVPAADVEKSPDNRKNQNADVCKTTAPTEVGPVVSNVWPLYGPEAGGTLVTVTGSELTDSEEPVIVFASSNSDHFVTLSTNATEQHRTSKRSYESMVVGKTPASRKIGEDLLVVVQYVDKPPVNTTRFFVYRQNPDVINIFPLSHLLSGGTEVTVTGNNIDAAAQPIITVTVVVTRFNLINDDDDDSPPTYQMTVTSERCTIKNSSVMTCTMPEVRLPSDFQVNDTVDQSTSVAAAGRGAVSLRGGPDDRDRADLCVGLQFDGFRDYANLTAAKPDVMFQFFQPPTFDTSTQLIVYRPESFSDIDITGRNLQRGVRIFDYRVVIGNGECNMSSLSDNQLTCRPPYDEPKLSDDDSFCDDDNSILVYVGNAGPFLYSCIRYDTEQDINIALIIGIVVGLVVLLVLLIVVVVVCVCKRRKEKQRTDDNIDLEMSPVDADNHPLDGRSVACVKSDNQQPAPVASGTHNGVLANVTEGYSKCLEPVDGDDDEYVGPSTTIEDVGYLELVDDSPGPVPSYIVPLPSPPPCDVKQEQTTADRADQTDVQSQGANHGYLTPFEDDAGGEHYISLSAVNKSPDTYTKLQLQDNDVGSPSTDSNRVSSQLTDDGYVTPIVKHQYEQTEISFQLPYYE